MSQIAAMMHPPTASRIGMAAICTSAQFQHREPPDFLEIAGEAVFTYRDQNGGT
jgi:hypothetical protein